MKTLEEAAEELKAACNELFLAIVRSLRLDKAVYYFAEKIEQKEWFR